jgi:hypothetical protein
LVFILIPLVYSTGQEKIAFNYPHDDYYFLMRSNDYDLRGEHLAYAREYLYSFFIDLNRIIGMPLRNTEVICFGIALFYLWLQVLNLSKSRLTAWVSVFPLLLFTYQHPVFNRVTYDTLQLILTPLTLGSALHLYSSRGSAKAARTAGIIAGLQLLTRPEGILFLVPPVIALLLLWLHRTKGDSTTPSKPITFWFLVKGVILLLIVPLLMEQSVCAFHYYKHGFWAPTIMKSWQFQASLRALMSIDPQTQTPNPYGSLPISSMEKAYAASPSFRKAKKFFSDHLDGAGWSGFAHYNYQAIDGSISGGHTQWAWFEAGASISGSRPDQILSYHEQVAEELNAAFQDGSLPKRHIWTTAFGAEFSPIGKPFLSSLLRLLKPLFLWDEPLLPQRTSRASSADVERNYTWLALRRNALVDDQRWQKLGWVLNPDYGIPDDIFLDETAVESNILLSLVNRPDVGQAILSIPADPETPVPVGFSLHVQGDASGHLVIRYTGKQDVLIPISQLRNVASNRTYKQDGVHLRVDDDFGNSGLASKTDLWIFHISTFLSIAIHWFMCVLLPLALLWIILVWISPSWLKFTTNQRRMLLVVVAVSMTLFIGRWVVMAAVDAGITPGTEPRYLAAGALCLWFTGTFSLAQAIYCVRTKRLTVSA